MPIYKPLPESLILTPKQIKKFERLQEALGYMKAWLESHNYQETAVEPVIIGKTSWLRKKEVKSVQYQRILPLPVALLLTGNTLYSQKMYAVNIDGELLVGRMTSEFPRGNHYKALPSNHPVDNAKWASAQFTGLNPDAIYSIVTAINKVTSG